MTRFAACLAAMAALVFAPLPAAAQPARCTAAECGEQLVYIGTQATESGQGIVAARFDSRTGKLTPIGLAAETKRPTWLAPHPDRPILYAVSEGGPEGTVLTLQANRATGLLRLLGSVGSGGGGPTHLALDMRSRTLFVANYGTGHVAALPVLRDGMLAAPASVQSNQGSGPHRRQQGPHAHGVALDPSGRFVLVADLGADRVFIHRYLRKARQLTPSNSGSEAVPAGHGPRHMAFHPSGRFLYLFTEIVPELRAYRWDSRRGGLTLVQAIPTVADPAKYPQSSGAEVKTTGDGRFVYVSNRGEDVIVAYAIDRRTGKLTEVQRIGAGGQRPWSFEIDPSGRWMFVANQASNSVVVFRREPATGRLTATGNSIEVPKPVSIAFLR